jgi:hypothetical protein
MLVMLVRNADNFPIIFYPLLSFPFTTLRNLSCLITLIIVVCQALVPSDPLAKVVPINLQDPNIRGVLHVQQGSYMASYGDVDVRK